MGQPEILLTNDDGIDATGLRVLREALSGVGSVTVVAPTEDQSATGRRLSETVSVHEHELGYAVDGTPSDSVIAGLEVLVPDADIVVAGCNEGANLGAHLLGRSGTVSAAVEATFFGTPAIAASLYVPVPSDITYEEVAVDAEMYEVAADAVRYLVDHAPEAGVFEQADYLNVNAPIPDEATGEMAVTRPSHVHRMQAYWDGTSIELADGIWEAMADGTVDDEEGTDRRAILDGAVSVSPLTAPHTTERHETLTGLAEAYALDSA